MPDDEFSLRYSDLVTDSYDCVDRIVLNAFEQLSIPVDQDLLRGLLRGRFVVGAFDELAVLELRAGADQCHEMGCVDRPPA